jgi:hypothetical protein
MAGSATPRQIQALSPEGKFQFVLSSHPLLWRICTLQKNRQSIALGVAAYYVSALFQLDAHCFGLRTQ